MPMRVALVHSPNRRRLLEWMLVLLGLGGLALGGHVAGIRVCPLRSLTGLPCPTCGATRAVLALACGDWQTAWFHHPLLTGLAIASAFYVCVAAATLLSIRRLPVLRASRATWMVLAIGLAVLVVVNWLYLLAR